MTGRRTPAVAGCLVVGAILTAAGGAAPAQTPTAKFEPPTGCYLGACIAQDPVAQGDFDAWERLTGRKHAVYGVEVEWGRPFPFRLAQGLWDHGSALQVTWVLPDAAAVPRSRRYLRGWAEAARRAELPTFLCLSFGSADPALEVAAWRQVRAVMAPVAPNVAMVWWPPSGSDTPGEQYYPGDEAVDWVGLSIRTVHHPEPGREAGAQDPREALRRVYDLYAPRKPIAVSEYAAAHACAVCGTDQVEFAISWAKQLYDALPVSFPRVKLINWVSAGPGTGGAPQPDFAVGERPELLNAYRALVARPCFLDSVVPGGTSPSEPDGGLQSGGGVTEAEGAIGALDYTSERGAAIVLDPEGEVVTGPVVVGAQIPEDLPVDHVEFRLDGRPRVVVTAPPYEFALDPGPLDPGEHLIELVLYDAADMAFDRASRAIMVER